VYCRITNLPYDFCNWLAQLDDAAGVLRVFVSMVHTGSFEVMLVRFGVPILALELAMVRFPKFKSHFQNNPLALEINPF
jgi:hypothetical protein